MIFFQFTAVFLTCHSLYFYFAINSWYTNYNGFYIEEKQPKSISFTINDLKEAVLEEQMFQLILNLTEDCNLRCRYCYLSDVYHFSRTRTESVMDLETGITALEYYFKILKKMTNKIPNKHAAISFYGGEPLLAFPVIKQLVKYANAHSPVPIVFNITTNGVLLSDEVVDYIVENKINTLVSIDGNKNDHDRNRVFPNGKGSFDLVFKNIKRFQERYPDYYQLMIACVYDLETNLKANIEFFDQNDMPVVIIVSKVSEWNSKYYLEYTVDDYEKFNKLHQEIESIYYEYKINRFKIPNYLGCYNELNFAPALIRPRLNDTKNPIIPYTSACLPGTKISVRVDGTIDLCERVNTTIPIGDIHNGLDFERIKAYIDNYNSKITEECYFCPVKKNCPLCFAYCCENVDFNHPYNFCTNFKGYMSGIFSKIYSILEENPNAFDHLEFITEETILFNN